MRQTDADRALSALIALLALGAVALRIPLTMTEDDLGLWAAIWDLVYFFTILTNAAIGALFATTALRGRAASAPVHAGLTVAIIVTGGVYHVLLRDLGEYEGLSLVTDWLLHTVVPALAALHWLVFAPKDGLRAGTLLPWLAYPMAYAAYVLIRAPHTGWYPYPFLDVTEQGWGLTLAWIGGIGLLFALLGAALLGIARLRA
ncbi:Pr6Pr family membrane protein [Histidinibacterium aquaticum]|uniref:Pr6Pr family membrane protein n=1 Tax=Histidinibacterium aquaticum TaxID=2613962 RepID=A0A5J5GH60_9RHOB|nr:Pr6Pr family membrane protein [Histidinibacterium aquaticum]KAA9007082.1 hypothetical protein F3S47_15070 [Histidinibacterium aquaticum]